MADDGRKSPFNHQSCIEDSLLATKSLEKNKEHCISPCSYGNDRVDTSKFPEKYVGAKRKRSLFDDEMHSLNVESTGENQLTTLSTEKSLEEKSYLFGHQDIIPTGGYYKRFLKLIDESDQYEIWPPKIYPKQSGDDTHIIGQQDDSQTKSLENKTSDHQDIRQSFENIDRSINMPFYKDISPSKENVTEGLMDPSCGYGQLHISPKDGTFGKLLKNTCASEQIDVTPVGNNFENLSSLLNQAVSPKEYLENITANMKVDDHLINELNVSSGEPFQSSRTNRQTNDGQIDVMAVGNNFENPSLLNQAVSPKEYLENITENMNVDDHLINELNVSSLREPSQSSLPNLQDYQQDISQALQDMSQASPIKYTVSNRKRSRSLSTENQPPTETLEKFEIKRIRSLSDNHNDLLTAESFWEAEENNSGATRTNISLSDLLNNNRNILKAIESPEKALENISVLDHLNTSSPGKDFFETSEANRNKCLSNEEDLELVMENVEITGPEVLLPPNHLNNLSPTDFSESLRLKTSKTSVSELLDDEQDIPLTINALDKPKTKLAPNQQKYSLQKSPSEIKKKQSKKIAKTESFKWAIHKLRKKKHPNMQLSAASKIVLDEILSHLMQKYYKELKALEKVKKFKTLSVKEMECATMLCLPKRLGVKAMEEGRKAVSKSRE